ncbi:unnamed protein product [Closterium sp. Yama58-4]|nr:unnamed protein product [Closterium sp. Yama58-4]
MRTYSRHGQRPPVLCCEGTMASAHAWIQPYATPSRRRLSSSPPSPLLLPAVVASPPPRHRLPSFPPSPLLPPSSPPPPPCRRLPLLPAVASPSSTPSPPPPPRRHLTLLPAVASPSSPPSPPPPPRRRLPLLPAVASSSSPPSPPPPPRRRLTLLLAVASPSSPPSRHPPPRRRLTLLPTVASSSSPPSPPPPPRRRLTLLPAVAPPSSPPSPPATGARAPARVGARAHWCASALVCERGLFHELPWFSESELHSLFLLSCAGSSSSIPLPMTWQCHVCASPCDGRIRCGECGVVIYCSRRHQANHWRQHEQGGECARLALQLQGAPDVLNLPFPFLHQSVIQVQSGAVL